MPPLGRTAAIARQLGWNPPPTGWLSTRYTRSSARQRRGQPQSSRDSSTTGMSWCQTPMECQTLMESRNNPRRLCSRSWRPVRDGPAARSRADQLEHLVAPPLHLLPRARLEVQPQERLGVRRSHVEVPAVGLDGDAIEVRDLPFAGVALLQLLQLQR